MNAIRPLIVDDSVVIRKMLAEVFDAIPNIQDCAVAANGKIAIEMIAQVSPDIVILDMEMPTLNGLDTLRELRKRHPNLPVIMFSSLTESGAKETIEALSMGATDYVTKPAGQSSLVETIDRIRSELVPRILAICERPHTVGKRPNKPAPCEGSNRGSQQPEILAIGGSTGGPMALESVLTCLPANFPLPIVVAQHMPPIFTARLADRLDSQCKISVSEASSRCELRPGHAWIAAGDGNMIVERKNQSTWCEPAPAATDALINPSVNVLFESVAHAFGDSAIALVLSGMGSDGKRGCEFIDAADGKVIVQDELSSVVWGMPGAVADAGLANEIVPLDKIGEMITQLTRGIEPRCSVFNGSRNTSQTT